MQFAEDDNGKCTELQCSAGTLTVPKFEDDQRYLALWPMFVLVDAFLEKSEPDLIIVEQTSSFKGGFVTGQVSQCMGVILAVCGKHETQAAFVYPSTVKKRVAGHGRATKTQMKKAVQEIIKQLADQEVKFDSEHAIDATANIICWLAQQGAIEVENDGK
jgi:Holliday junction resolvasome RuvABC endonuclease subunit